MTKYGRRRYEYVQASGSDSQSAFHHTASGLRLAIAAIMAGEFLLASGEGAVYSVSEIRGWLEAAGWHMRDHLALAGPASVVVGEAV